MDVKTGAGAEVDIMECICLVSLSETLTEELQKGGIAAVFFSDLSALCWCPKTVTQTCCNALNDKRKSVF